MTPITTAGYSNFSITDINIMFQSELEDHPADMIKSLYVQQPWTSGDPKRMTFDTFALPTYTRRVAENEAAPQLSITEGDTLQKEFFKFAGVWDYTIEMKTFDKEDMIQKFAKNLVDALNANVDHELTMQILSYANATTITPMDVNDSHSIATPDAVAPGSASHTVNGGGLGNISNILSGGGALNLDNATTLIGQGQRVTVNDAGRNVRLNLNACVIPDYFPMVKKATEIFGSQLTPETSNNAMNVFRPGAPGGMTVIALKKGALNSQGVWDTTRQHFYSFMDLDLVGANKWATTGEAAVVPVSNPQAPNALFSLMGYKFLTYGMVRWQGKMYSFATTV